MSETPRPTPKRCSPIAPALASLTIGSIPSRCSSSAAGLIRPSPAGCPRRGRARRLVHRRGQADPGADHVRRSTPASASAAVVSRCARSNVLSGSMSVLLDAHWSAMIRPPRSQTALRTWRCPKSSPTAYAALGASDTCSGGRPIAGGRSSSTSCRCCSTMPASSSSFSSAVTVARESPSERRDPPGYERDSAAAPATCEPGSHVERWESVTGLSSLESRNY